MLEVFSTTEQTWKDAVGTTAPGFADSESTRFVGRAVAADSQRARWNQASVTSAHLAREFGFTDLDGTRPDCWAALEGDG